jgi:hypothetical protein
VVEWQLDLDPTRIVFIDETAASRMLRQEAGKSRKQKRTIKQLHADLVVLGYEGSYNRVAAFAHDWRAARQREQKTAGRGVFVPLAFMAGEAIQFDWSEDWAVIAGERTKLQIAHFKLSCSRAFFLRAYPQQTHEMLFDAHNHAFRVLGRVPRRGIYDNMRTAVDKIGRGKNRQVNARFAAMVSHFLQRCLPAPARPARDRGPCKCQKHQTAVYGGKGINSSRSPVGRSKRPWPGEAEAGDRGHNEVEASTAEGRGNVLLFCGGGNHAQSADYLVELRSTERTPHMPGLAGSGPS